MRNCTSCGAAVSGRSRYCDDCRDTKAPWRPDCDNIDRARNHLGINIRVVVRRTNSRRLLGRYHGLHIAKDAPQDPDVIFAMDAEELGRHIYHYVTVSARMTVEAASRTLWHELTHAAQNERVPDWAQRYAAEMEQARYAATFHRTDIASTYGEISFEVEARANEENHYSLFSLALANKRASMPMLKRPHERIHSVIGGTVIPGHQAEAYEHLAHKNIRTAKLMRGTS